MVYRKLYNQSNHLSTKGKSKVPENLLLTLQKIHQKTNERFKLQYTSCHQRFSSNPKNQFLSKIYQFTSKNLTFHGLFYFWINCKKVVDNNFDGCQGWTQSSLPLKKHTNCKLLLCHLSTWLLKCDRNTFENPAEICIFDRQ